MGFRAGSGKLLKLNAAGVAKLAYAADSKSAGVHSPWGFKSLLRHKSHQVVSSFLDGNFPRAPMIEDLAKEMAGRVRSAKLNVDENPLTASRFRVMTIPTLLVLKGGRRLERIVGVQPKNEIVKRSERVAA